MSQLYYVMTMPGLETLAFNEIRAHIADATLVKFARGIALFRSAASPIDFLDLRMAEDVFVVLAHIVGLGSSRDALRVLHSATAHADIDAALTAWRRAHDGRRATSWRVVSQKVGSHAFRRVDAGLSVGSALQKVLPRNFHQVKDDADIEAWVWLNGSEALIGFRLSDATMRHRIYKTEHQPASLRPTVAAAMSWLSQPTDQDIVLDPLCGVGTVLIERAQLASYERLIGGDNESRAITMARRNARAAAIDASWHVWDARSLPLDDASVTRIITNPPFGKQIGSHETNKALYEALGNEFHRVLAPGGFIVTLTSEDQLWETVARVHGWTIIKRVVIVVLGQPASIFVTKKV